MSFSVMAGVIIFLASVILSQKLSVNAGDRLDDATKLKLLEFFPKRNVNYTIAVFAIITMYLIAVFAWPQYSQIIGLVFAITFLAYLFAKQILNVRKLRKIGASDRYITSVIASFSVFVGGAVLAAIVFAVGSGRVN